MEEGGDNLTEGVTYDDDGMYDYVDGMELFMVNIHNNYQLKSHKYLNKYWNNLVLDNKTLS